MSAAPCDFRLFTRSFNEVLLVIASQRPKRGFNSIAVTNELLQCIIEPRAWLLASNSSISRCRAPSSFSSISPRFSLGR